ncbi:MAG: type IV secretion system protein [Candidatus Rickettsiella isopodorum]|nr:type IV secretion system protein [Gammaproteobacteria bacterium]
MLNPIKSHRTYKTIVLSLFMILSFPSYADPISDLVNIAAQIQGYQLQISSIQNTIQGLTHQIQDAVSGQSEWGHSQFTDHQSWGENTDRWGSVLSMAGNTGNNSQLGRTLRALAEEFPVATELYNSVNPNKMDQKYYALKAKTALAARAASQLSYDKIQDQINYANQLRQQIGTTATLKQSVDLESRLTLENNLIQLEMLRQLALINQQHAIDAQAEVNEAVQNAHFLNANYK